jgi:hypothetical protein
VGPKLAVEGKAQIKTLHLDGENIYPLKINQSSGYYVNRHHVVLCIIMAMTSHMFLTAPL